MVSHDAGAEALGALLLAPGGVGRRGVVAVAVPAARGVRRVRPVVGPAAAGVQLADQLREGPLVLVVVVVVVGADVAGLLGPLLLLVEGLEHGGLDHLAAAGVDWVGDVGVQLGPAVGVAGRPVLVELG